MPKTARIWLSMQRVFHRLAAPLIMGCRLVQLTRNRFSSPNVLAARNLARFRRMARQSLVKSSYYGKIMREKGIDPKRCTIQDFPPLTKDLLLQHYDDIVTDKRVTRATIEAFLSRSKNPLDLLEGDFFVVHTSGSSGQVTPIVWHKMDWFRGLVNFARVLPPRMQTKLAFIGATDGHYAGVTMSQSSGWGPLWWTHRVKAFDIRRPLSDLVTELNAFNPSVLIGYAKALRDLSVEKASGHLKITPKRILSGGEPLITDDRKLIVSAFGAPVINTYAASEHMLIAVGFPGLDGMIVQEDDLIIEAHSDHTLITNLLNKTLPLVRYRMDDVLCLRKNPETGWPAHRIIEEIIGRQEHAPRFLNETGQLDTIHPIVFVEFFVRGLDAFQIVVNGNDSFVFLAVVRSDRPQAETLEDIKHRLDEILTTKRMGNVKYTVELIDHLSADPATGKFQLIRNALVMSEGAPSATS